MLKDRSDRLIIITIVVLILVVLLILTTGRLGGPRVLQTFPGANSTASALGRIGLAFDEPMQPESVERYFSINPSVSGQFRWEENTLWFKPDSPLEPGTAYTVALKRYARSLEGQRLNRDLQFSFSIRQPEVVYLRVGERGGDLYSINLTGDTVFRLTTTGGKVYDYEVSPDGEWIAFSVDNDQAGRDLWLVNRNGRTRRVLVKCGIERCQSPDWKFDGTFIAYSHAGITAKHKMIRVFTVAFPAGESLLLAADENQQGDLPQWSPDGLRLAYYDPSGQMIRIREIESGREMAVKTDISAVGCWSPDSKNIFYSAVVKGEANPFFYPVRIDVETGQTTPLNLTSGKDLDFGTPACDATGQWLVVGARHPGGPSARQLWLLRTDGSELRQITNDVLVSHAAYRWDPWGRMIIFQQLKLNSSTSSPEVVIWQMDTGKMTVLVESAGLPQWIP